MKVFQLTTNLSRKKTLNVSRMLLVMSCFLLSAERSWALCSATSDTKSFPSGLVIQRDAPMGSVLAVSQFYMRLTCENFGSPGSSPWRIIVSTSNADHGDVPGYPGVRRTQYPGIGIRWATQPTGMASINHSLYSFNSGASRWTTSGKVVNGLDVYDSVQFIRIPGELVASTISSRVFSYSYSSVDTSVPITPLTTHTLTGGATQIGACDVISSNLIASLGLVDVKAFNGVDTFAGAATFSIPLNCTAGTKVNVRIDPAAGGIGVPGKQGVLALNSAGTAGVARGVGIQVLLSGNPVTLGAAMAAGTPSTTGSYFVPMTARYYQTEGSIQPGEANGTATFTMTYN